MNASRYVVKIHYREPLYARSRGLKEKVYSGSFDVTAPNSDLAITKALFEFHRIASISRVSWPREIERIEVAESR